MNGSNNWNVPFSSIAYVETTLKTHNRVKSFVRDRDIQFDIERTGEYSKLRAVFINQYHLGEAAAYAVLAEFEKVDFIVNIGNWNHIVLDWHAFAERTGVAVLQFADFLGALNSKNLTTYVTRDEREARARSNQRSA